MAKIIKLSSYKTLIKNPKLSELYDKYDDITEAQCYSLIITLYDNDKIFWVNPLDWNFIHKAGDISISFLSKCYYVWGDNIVMAGPDKGLLKLSYKEHIKKFIDKVSNADTRQAKTIILTIEESRQLRDELAKLLVDLQNVEKETTDPVFEVVVSGGKFK